MCSWERQFMALFSAWGSYQASLKFQSYLYKTKNQNKKIWTGQQYSILPFPEAGRGNRFTVALSIVSPMLSSELDKYSKKIQKEKIAALSLSNNTKNNAKSGFPKSFY